MIDLLLERHKTSIPNHEPKLYCSAAAGTRSVPGFNILSFPDFWGHVPPPGHESMAQRTSGVQRYTDFIGWRFTGDLTSRTVFSPLGGALPVINRIKINSRSNFFLPHGLRHLLLNLLNTGGATTRAALRDIKTIFNAIYVNLSVFSLSRRVVYFSHWILVKNVQFPPSIFRPELDAAVNRLKNHLRE